MPNANMLRKIAGKIKNPGSSTRKYSLINSETSDKFVTVFSFPFAKNLALFNRLKTYQIIGSSLAVPTSGLLEMLNVLPNQSFLTAAYIGFTGAAVLSVASLPFKNTIGFLYISEDNKFVKISSVDFWGKRVDKTIPAKDWMPLLDLPTKMTDVLFLSPQLTDNTKYKLFVKFGIVLDAKKIGQVLE